MNRICCIVLLVFCALIVNGQAKKPQEWNDKNFDENLKKYGKAFIKFYAPWCGHCKRLAPIWEEVADTLDESYSALVKIDCTDSGKETCQRFSVNGYPTLKFVTHSDDGNDPADSAVDYNGRRDKNSLINFAKKYGSQLYKVLDDSEVPQFINQETESAFILFTKSNKTDAFKSYVAACKKLLGHAQYGVSYTNDPKKLLEFASPESVVFQRSKQLTTNLENPNGSTKDINEFYNFIKSNLNGRVAIRTSDNDETINRPLLTVFLASSSFNTNTSYFKMIRNRLFPLADKYTDMQFAVASMEEFSGYIDSVGFSASKDDIVFTIDDAEHRRYVPKVSIKYADVKTLPDLLRQFLDAYKDGLVDVYYKSQPIPEKHTPGEPMVVVAKNFEDIVFDKTKDVFIKMYAPWCTHCKKLAPIWDQLAEKLKNEENVIIAKFDATENDIVHPQYNIEGFPTLFFAKANDKKNPIQYSGSRTFDALLNFVKQHSTKLTQIKDEL